MRTEDGGNMSSAASTADRWRSEGTAVTRKASLGSPSATTSPQRHSTSLNLHEQGVRSGGPPVARGLCHSM